MRRLDSSDSQTKQKDGCSLNLTINLFLFKNNHFSEKRNVCPSKWIMENFDLIIVQLAYLTFVITEEGAWANLFSILSSIKTTSLVLYSKIIPRQYI